MIGGGYSHSFTVVPSGLRIFTRNGSGFAAVITMSSGRIRWRTRSSLIL